MAYAFKSQVVSAECLIQGFSNGALDPLGGHGAVLWGPRAEAFTRHLCRDIGIFIDEQSATSVESLLKGATARLMKV